MTTPWPGGSNRKPLALLLALCLLLCSCSAPSDAAPSAGTAPSVPEASGLYDPDASLEHATGGAVKCYPLDDNTHTAIIPAENGLLLQSRENTRLTLFAGENLVPAVEKQIPFHLTQLYWGKDGFSYPDADGGSLVFLNNTLREVGRMTLPAGITGQPWLCSDWSSLYYCTAAGLHRMDLKTGISRLLAEEKSGQLTVTGMFLDGSVIGCCLTQPDGTLVTQMRSGENGSILWEGTALKKLDTAGESWFAQVDRGTVQELLFHRDGTVSNLWLETEYDQILPLAAKNAVLACRKTELGCSIDYYDLVTGCRTASLQLEGVGFLKDICIDASGNRVWLLCDRTAAADMLCRWNPEASSIDDPLDYTQPHYTRDRQDAVGLAALRAQLKPLEESHRIRLLIGDAADIAGSSYALETEYLVPAYQKYLPLLQQHLGQFPEQMFIQAAKQTPSGLVHIALVRSFQGETPVVHIRQNGEIYLVLSMDEALQQNFYHGVYHILETRLLSSSAAMYDWSKLNPAGFSYDNTYTPGEDGYDSSYFTGNDRAFIDRFSMHFLREDRARILEYACMPGNEDLFSSPILQKKLQMLCKGIRETFAVKDSGLLWEQYLADNI